MSSIAANNNIDMHIDSIKGILIDSQSQNRNDNDTTAVKAVVCCFRTYTNKLLTLILLS